MTGLNRLENLGGLTVALGNYLPREAFAGQDL